MLPTTDGIKKGFQNRLIVKALSILEKLLIHLLLHDSLYFMILGIFWHFILIFLLVSLHVFSSDCFVIHYLIRIRQTVSWSTNGIVIRFGLRSSWTGMRARKIDWLMGLGLTSGWTDVLAGKIDWLMGLGQKSKCEVSSGKLNSGTSGNLLIILSTSFRISSQMSISFPTLIVDMDLFHFHSSLNHFQQTSEKRKQST